VLSETPLDSHDAIKEYLENSFLPNKPQAKILESHVTIGDNGTWALDNGICQWISKRDGNTVVNKERYSFFYTKEEDNGGEWKISHHHSSQMPEELLNAQPLSITKKECQQLFHLWNDALATLDAKIVASRYARHNAVLLPTVSDVPRTTPQDIEAYFVDFLKRKPQGKILESFVTIGHDYCQDAGIYEFELDDNGKKSKVRARYTFLYVQEDGEWKIAHQHSSQMPEEIEPKGTAEREAKANEGVPNTLDEKQVRALFDLWNDALATGNAQKVASRYSKKSAILLPTTSDEPCMDEASITDYFVDFLK
jgi:uncharacterized protein (TIGR02246 family)